LGAQVGDLIPGVKDLLTPAFMKAMIQAIMNSMPSSWCHDIFNSAVTHDPEGLTTRLRIEDSGIQYDKYKNQ
jgi:hypothetical protein